MTGTIRLFMLLEATSFVAASLIHSGVFITGYEHPQARTGEGVIAAVLITGLILSFVRRSSDPLGGAGGSRVCPPGHAGRSLHHRDRRRSPHCAGPGLSRCDPGGARVGLDRHSPSGLS